MKNLVFEGKTQMEANTSNDMIFLKFWLYLTGTERPVSELTRSESFYVFFFALNNRNVSFFTLLVDMKGVTIVLTQVCPRSNSS